MHKDFLHVFHQLTLAPSKAAKKKIAKAIGIRGLPALQRVGSLNFAQSTPWEWFHLLLKNIIPTLVELWTGQFKGMESAVDEFRIAPHI